MIVRLERVDDRPASMEVERAAFPTAEEATIVERVRDEPGSFALVAELDGAIIGHVQLSAAWIGDAEVLALGPIGVRPDDQGRGVGSTLLREALSEAARRGAAAVVLLGSPTYYGARGFEPASRYGFANRFAGARLEVFEIAEADFQVAVLDEPRVRSMSGEVRWHPAFG